MAGRRPRRAARGQTLLPVRTTRLSHTFSCWYCDFKISTLNDPLLSFGRRHARLLRVWFSAGVGVGVMALVVAIAILLHEFIGALYLHNGSSSTGILFGFSSLVPGLRISALDAGYMISSTLMSIAVHEFGHAIAAARVLLGVKFFIWILVAVTYLSCENNSKNKYKATYMSTSLDTILTTAFCSTVVINSEGVHIEYIAIFLAVLLPGALVAFNYELLRNLPHLAALRVYCAGIWHNAVCCGICGLALFLMPLLLYPLYRHGEYPMVLSVSSESALSESLSYGDLIISLDGISIHDPQEWTEKMASIDFQAQQESDRIKDSQSMKAISSRRGYCVPNYWIDESKKIEPEDEWDTCPGDLMPFRRSPYFDLSLSYDQNSHCNGLNLTGHMYCLLAKDVVKLKKCSDRWQTSSTNGNSCACLKIDCLDKPSLIDPLEQDETCLSPVEKPGLRWVEIAYSSPYSSECSHFRRTSLEDFVSHNSSSDNCGGTFIFVGDLLSEAHSVQLTPYWPHWRSKFGLHFPHLLEKSLAYTYHVSATLALLNSLPVFFLDGESIMEVLLCSVARLNPRRQQKYLRVCLMGGTLLSIFAFSQIFISIILRYPRYI